MFPLTPKMIVKPKPKVVDEEKAANLAAAEEEVTSHKRALEKRQNLKKKIIADIPYLLRTSTHVFFSTTISSSTSAQPYT